MYVEWVESIQWLCIHTKITLIRIKGLFGFCFQQNNNHQYFHHEPIGRKRGYRGYRQRSSARPVVLKRKATKRWDIVRWRRRKKREQATWVIEGNEGERKKNQGMQREKQLSPSIRMLWQQLTGRESCSLLLSFHHRCPPTRLPNACFLFP